MSYELRGLGEDAPPTNPYTGRYADASAPVSRYTGEPVFPNDTCTGPSATPRASCAYDCYRFLTGELRREDLGDACYADCLRSACVKCGPGETWKPEGWQPGKYPVDNGRCVPDVGGSATAPAPSLWDRLFGSAPLLDVFSVPPNDASADPSSEGAMPTAETGTGPLVAAASPPAPTGLLVLLVAVGVGVAAMHYAGSRA